MFVPKQLSSSIQLDSSPTTLLLLKCSLVIFQLNECVNLKHLMNFNITNLLYSN
ncbi:hypothetical protein LguiA_004597 [Lonicera macranthoides]